MQKDIDYSKFKSLEEAYKAGYDQGVQDEKIETTQIQILDAQQSLDRAKLTAWTNCALNTMNIIANESVESSLPIVKFESSPSTIYQKQVIKPTSWFRRIIDKILH